MADEMQWDRVIMGIDPGTNVMGYGVIGIKGKRLSMIAAGVVTLSKFPDHYLKLRHIYDRTLALVTGYLPDELAIEAPFFGKNVQSMLKLGRAQGVAIAAALNHGMPIHEYAPLSIKQAVTGTGSASKERVAAMLKNILHMTKEEMPEFLDATDALGAALTHFYEETRPVPRGDGSKNWAEFLAKNPDRIATRRKK